MQAATPSSGVSVFGGQAYVMLNGTSVAALDATTGAVRWTFSIPSSMVATYPPSMDDEYVYLTTRSTSSLYAVDPLSGGVVWSQSLSSPSYDAPVIANGNVVSNTLTGTVSVSSTNGVIEWSSASCEGHSSPAITGGLVLVEGNNFLCALNSASGALTWRDTALAGHLLGTRGRKRPGLRD